MVRDRICMDVVLIIYLVYQFVDWSLPLEEDLIEAAEWAGVGHVPRIRDGHVAVTLTTWPSNSLNGWTKTTDRVWSLGNLRSLMGDPLSSRLHSLLYECYYLLLLCVCICIAVLKSVTITSVGRVYKLCHLFSCSVSGGDQLTGGVSAILVYLEINGSGFWPLGFLVPTWL